MKMRVGMPAVQVKPDTVAVSGGMDISTPPMFAKPGTARIAYNYEWDVGGGAKRVLGLDTFDGRPSPSSALYTLLTCTATVTGILVGDTLDGATSGASGQVIYIDGADIAMTKVTGGAFEDGEDLELSAVVVATVETLDVEVDGFLDNSLSKAAADVYQADITKVPGSGRVRGLAVLNGVVYAWRNNAGGTALVIYKSSASGWTLVALQYELSFTLGSGVQPVDGVTIAQGGTSATLKRVVLESGTYLAGTAAGRYIITIPSGGAFAAGALTTAAQGTVPAAGTGVYHGTAITLAPGGRVRTDRYTFTAALADQRLYGCDGINREFEFDGTTLAPITTGMGTIRASAVRCHKQHLTFAYRGSLQISGIGAPFVWSAVFGAAELGTGDEITNLLSIGGASDAAALFVLCRNALFVLYGNGSSSWNLVPLSRVSGALPDSAQDIGGVLALDTPGVMRYPASQNFGNFAWDTVSMAVQPLTRTQQCACSVYASGFYRYRIFFEDGTAISGLPLGEKKVLWSVIDYGVTIVLAEHAEIDGNARTFYADTDGWVYEADKGRSFAGRPIQYALKLNPLNQKSPIVTKKYRQMVVEVKAESAFTMSTSAEFNDDEGLSQQTDTRQYGAGLIFDLTNYDESYWDTAAVGHKTVPLEGIGESVAISIAGESDNEMPNTVYAMTILYTPRKITR